MYTYQEVLDMVRDDAQQLTDSRYPEDLLNEWAQGCVPIYTAEIQSEWVALDFDDQNRWEECFSLKDLGEDKDLNYLMTVDLALYYEGLFSRAWAELQEELEPAE
jgi:hypothetical protein